MSNILLWYYTVRHLKPRQVVYRVLQPLIVFLLKERKTDTASLEHAKQSGPLPLQSLNVSQQYQPATKTFSFLNVSRSFPNGIDWDFSENGLLWTFNLNYFEWLYDDWLSVEDRYQTITEFVTTEKKRSTAVYAYPTSLRIVAWTRFLSRFGCRDEQVCRRLYADADRLCRCPEYAIDGNHLLENAIALTCAGVFFNKTSFLQKGTHLLRSCLSEQILDDGAHIEGSPMYHSLISWRLLQCLELLQADGKKTALALELQTNLAKMLHWLRAITFHDGSWPHFNDSTPGIAPDTQELFRYGALLGIAPGKPALGDSGYRMMRVGAFELCIHIAPVQPAYQPGHTHDDMGTFCLHYEGRPVVVDTGISTYEPGPRRSFERSAEAHNAVALAGKGATELWKSFRVGRRPVLVDRKSGDNFLTLTYRPFFSRKILHQRMYSWTDNAIHIRDEVTGTGIESVARVHLSPEYTPTLRSKQEVSAGGLIFKCGDGSLLTVAEYDVANGFNVIEPACCLELRFKKVLELWITCQSADNK